MHFDFSCSSSRHCRACSKLQLQLLNAIPLLNCSLRFPCVGCSSGDVESDLHTRREKRAHKLVVVVSAAERGWFAWVCCMFADFSDFQVQFRIKNREWSIINGKLNDISLCSAPRCCCYVVDTISQKFVLKCFVALPELIWLMCPTESLYLKGWG